MKKFAWLIAAAIPMAFAFTSCGDDENPQEIYLNTNSAAISYHQTQTLTATEKNCNWSSDNEFVATVDKDGVVTANHVGEATITAEKNGVSASCKVTVVATNTAFTLPVLDWGATVAQVKAKVPTNLKLVQDEADELGYESDGNGGFPAYGYTFTNNALDGAGLVVTLQQDEEGDLMGLLDQNFLLFNENDEEGIFEYINANTEAEATTGAQYELNDAGNVSVFFYPMNASNRGGDKEATIFRVRTLMHKIVK